MTSLAENPLRLVTSDKGILSEPIDPAMLLDAILPLDSSGGQGGDVTPLARYLDASIAPATRRAYRSDLAHFLAWGGTIPATSQIIAEYLAAHAESLAAKTLMRRVVAISFGHSVLGLENPTLDDLVRRTMRGIRRVHGKPPVQAKPLLIEDLEKVVAAIGDDLRGLRDRALLLTGFHGAFRRSELVAISTEDIEFGDANVVIRIPRSKADQFAKGRSVAISRSSVACPVHALEVWQQTSELTGGAIFRSILKSNRMGCQAFVPETVTHILKVRLAVAGIDPKGYSSHSLRAGYVTSALAYGMPIWEVKHQTGHSSFEMVDRYNRN